MAAIALLLVNAVGGLGYFFLSLPERSEWGDLTTGLICSIVAALLILNYRRTHGSSGKVRP
ncbi:hypothetical protein [Arthrobacter sp. SX1312]|uniref:hypothetical protein n=1 Tax=Arthrobacter sp. SX1312 TaxID=2058896 RepID=UPI000CE4DBC6|nr:hypothetical protein [Arthrobacter sp. SX1312]